MLLSADPIWVWQHASDLSIYIQLWSVSISRFFLMVSCAIGTRVHTNNMNSATTVSHCDNLTNMPTKQANFLALHLQQKGDVGWMLVYCWASVPDVDLVIYQHLMSVWCFLGHYSIHNVLPFPDPINKLTKSTWIHSLIENGERMPLFTSVCGRTIMKKNNRKITRDVNTDAGPTLNRHWIKVSCWLVRKEAPITSWEAGSSVRSLSMHADGHGEASRKNT